MYDHNEEASFKITITEFGCQVEIHGNPDEIAHGLAKAIETTPHVNKLISHALLISMEDIIGEKSKKIQKEKVKAPKKSKTKEKVIN